MSKKEEFMVLAEKAGYEQVSIIANWKNELNLTKFVMVLNGNPALRKAFREAVAEAKGEKEPSAEEQATAGLANLFGGQ